MNDFIGKAIKVGDYVAYVMVGNGHLCFGKIISIGKAKATVQSPNGGTRIVIPANLVKVEPEDAMMVVLKR